MEAACFYEISVSIYRLHEVTSQERVTPMLTTVRTPNLTEYIYTALHYEKLSPKAQFCGSGY
jgi:hypothetical protein